ncbi:MAG: transcriptional repressor [Verrucomicrobia bacterium]|nr:transcriptional repressor [Verrucomicrobiota bacterium]
MVEKLPDETSMRMTPQRRVILEELRACMAHPTAREIFDRVRMRLPRISLATVYRNLDSLSRQGIIRQMESGGVERRYDGDTLDHYHLRCVRCGRIEDAPLGRLSGMEETVARSSGYTVLGHRIEFEGICPGCRGDETDASRGARYSQTTDCPDEGITH